MAICFRPSILVHSSLSLSFEFSLSSTTMYVQMVYEYINFLIIIFHSDYICKSVEFKSAQNRQKERWKKTVFIHMYIFAEGMVSFLFRLSSSTFSFIFIWNYLARKCMWRAMRLIQFLFLLFLSVPFQSDSIRSDPIRFNPIQTNPMYVCVCVLTQ